MTAGDNYLRTSKLPIWNMWTSEHDFHSMYSFSAPPQINQNMKSQHLICRFFFPARFTAGFLVKDCRDIRMKASVENVRRLVARNLHCGIAEVPLLELFVQTMAALASRNEATGRHCLVTHSRYTDFQVNYVRTS